MGDFIFSFFKELNSASNKKMIALAIVLGLISGFLPTFTFINYVILFFVFIFRIPLGLYFASFTVFSLISYILDPIFNKIGYFILTFEPLKPLWTFLYNLPLVRWSGFNNTLVMGSLISGVIIGIVLYYVLNRSIDTYREKMFPKIKKIKFLSWIVPKEEKKGIIRVSGLIAFIGIFGVITAFLVLLLDPIVKTVLEFTLSKTLHKKVSIESVNVKVLEPSIDINKLQIDTFLIKKAYVKLNSYYLLWKKFEIQKAIVEAKTNQSLAELIQKKNKKSASIASKINITPPKASDIFATYQPKSLKAVEKLKKDYNEFNKFIKTQKIDSYQKDIEKIKKEIENLSKAKIKTPQDLDRLIKEVKNIQKEIDKLKSSVKEKKTEILKYKKILSDDLNEVKKAIKEDYAYIDNKYKMIKQGEYIEFTKSFLAPKIKGYVSVIQTVYEKVKPYLPKKEQKENIVISRKGIYIKFEDKIKYPDFVLKDGRVSLKTSIAKYKLNIKNLADNQKILNKYAVITLNGNSDFYKLKALVKYLSDIRFIIKGTDIKLKEMDFEKLKFIHPVFDVNIEGKYFKVLEAKFKAVIKNSEIKLKIENDIDKYIAKVLQNIHRFKLYGKIYGEIDNPSIELSSDLDKIISKAVMKIYEKELNKQKERAKTILDKKIKENLKKVNLKEVDINLNNIENLENNLDSLKKEAVKIIEKKKKSLIKNKIPSSLKGLF